MGREKGWGGRRGGEGEREGREKGWGGKRGGGRGGIRGGEGEREGREKGSGGRRGGEEGKGGGSVILDKILGWNEGKGRHFPLHLSLSLIPSSPLPTSIGPLHTNCVPE